MNKVFGEDVAEVAVIEFRKPRQLWKNVARVALWGTTIVAGAAAGLSAVQAIGHIRSANQLESQSDDEVSFGKVLEAEGDKHDIAAHSALDISTRITELNYAGNWYNNASDHLNTAAGLLRDSSIEMNDSSMNFLLGAGEVLVMAGSIGASRSRRLQ